MHFPYNSQAETTMSTAKTTAPANGTKKTSATEDLRAKLAAVKKQQAEAKPKPEEVVENGNESGEEETVEEKVESKPKKVAVKKSSASSAPKEKAPPKEKPAKKEVKLPPPKDEDDGSLTMDGIVAIFAASGKFNAGQWKTAKAAMQNDAKLHAAADQLAHLFKRIDSTRTGNSIIKSLDAKVVKLLLSHLKGPSYSSAKNGKTVEITPNDDVLAKTLTSLEAGYTTSEHISLVIKLLPKTNDAIKVVDVEGGLPNSKALVLDGEWATTLEPFVKALNKKRKKDEGSDGAVDLTKIKPRDLALVIETAMSSISDEDSESVEEQHSSAVDSELEALRLAVKHYEKLKAASS